MTQAERLARRDALRADIAKLETELDSLRTEEAKLLDGCEHAYADGRNASAGGKVKICAVCGKVLKQKDEKLWG